MTKLGTDLAVALVPVGVNIVVTPEAVQAMFDAKSAATTTGRGSGADATGGVAVMPVGIPKQDIVIEHHGLSTFKVKTRGKPGAAIFRRYGLGWKLAGSTCHIASARRTPECIDDYLAAVAFAATLSLTICTRCNRSSRRYCLASFCRSAAVIDRMIASRVRARSSRSALLCASSTYPNQ